MYQTCPLWKFKRFALYLISFRGITLFFSFCRIFFFFKLDIALDFAFVSETAFILSLEYTMYFCLTSCSYGGIYLPFLESLKIMQFIYNTCHCWCKNISGNHLYWILKLKCFDNMWYTAVITTYQFNDLLLWLSFKVVGHSRAIWDFYMPTSENKSWFFLMLNQNESACSCTHCFVHWYWTSFEAILL